MQSANQVGSLFASHPLSPDTEQQWKASRQNGKCSYQDTVMHCHWYNNSLGNMIQAHSKRCRQLVTQLQMHIITVKCADFITPSTLASCLINAKPLSGTPPCRRRLLLDWLHKATTWQMIGR